MHPQSSGPKEVVVEAEGGPIKVAKRPATALAGPHKVRDLTVRLWLHIPPILLSVPHACVFALRTG